MRKGPGWESNFKVRVSGRFELFEGSSYQNSTVDVL